MGVGYTGCEKGPEIEVILKKNILQELGAFFLLV
jgi:hypothetical protein